MVLYRRNFVPGGTFFITATLANRSSSVLTDQVAYLRASVMHARRHHPFVIDAVVILPDHLHMVMTLPEGDADFSIRCSLIKRRFTDAVIKAGLPIVCHQNGEIALWQRRFWEHTVRDDRDFERHVDYIHFNPVKHGLVNRVCDWPHSSFHRYVRQGILPADWGGDVGHFGGSFGEHSDRSPAKSGTSSTQANGAPREKR